MCNITWQKNIIMYIQVNAYWNHKLRNITHESNGTIQSEETEVGFKYFSYNPPPPPFPNLPVHSKT